MLSYNATAIGVKEITRKKDVDVEMLHHFFPNFFDVNEYGCLSHVFIDCGGNNENVLKALDLLFKNRLNVNYQAKETGYTFLHLAFYGYTISGKDFSYSDDFLIKLVGLAKKHNFDFNLKDKDGDTIIHSALASEVYTGDVLKIIELIKDDFDFSSVDNNGKNIYEALLSYINEARKDGNRDWFNRLERAKDKIRELVDNYNNKENDSNMNKTVETEEEGKSSLEEISEAVKDEKEDNQLEKTTNDTEEESKEEIVVEVDNVDDNEVIEEGELEEENVEINELSTEDIRTEDETKGNQLEKQQMILKKNPKKRW